VAQRYDTVFPAQLLAALNDPAADLDKNGRVSCGSCSSTRRAVWRGTTSSRGCWPPSGRCSTTVATASASRPATTPARTGPLARATYLEREAVEVNADAEMAALIARRRSLEERAEQLRQKKSSMPQEAWEREFEQLMIELARVSHRIPRRLTIDD
jgi:hypothetical protein